MKLKQVLIHCKRFVTEKNWPSSYTYFGRYHDIGITDKVVEYADKSRKKYLKILDVGCSVGVAAREMKDEIANLRDFITVEIVGIDVNEHVQEKALTNLDSFILGDILKTEMEEEFDVVICSRMMLCEYAYKKSKIVKKLSELIKEDGCLVTDCRSYKRKNTNTSLEQDLDDMLETIKSLKHGWKSFNNQLSKIKRREMKKRIEIIIGKKQVSEFSEEISVQWQKMDSLGKGLFLFDIAMSKLLAYGNKKPSCRKPWIRG